jgi:radical SAM superfamily enzyme YgiQ (UPF0313 family)
MTSRSCSRVLLCSPPWSYGSLGAPRPRPGGRDITGQGRLPELGLHFLATTLRAHGHHSEVLEGYGLSQRELLRRISAAGPDVVGIAVQSPLWPGAQELIAALRSSLPRATRVVVGGPHATLRGGALFEDAPGLDAVFTGPAEGSLLAWLDGGCPRDALCHASEDPDHDPAWASAMVRRVPWRRYQPNLVFLDRRPFATSVSSIGCARACASCAVGGSGGGRARSAGALFAEQRILGSELGIRCLSYMDDMTTFVRPGDEHAALLARLAAEGPFLRWSIYLDRFDLDAARFEALRRAGCTRVMMLVESGHPGIRSYAKGRPVAEADIHRSAARARAAGLEVGARFQIGFPGETPEQAQASIELAQALPLELASFFRAMAYPGSSMERDYRQRGLATDDLSRWSYYGRPVQPDAMSPRQQDALISDAVRRFYGRPRAAWTALGSGSLPRRLGRGLTLARRFFLDGAA